MAALSSASAQDAVQPDWVPLLPAKLSDSIGEEGHAHLLRRLQVLRLSKLVANLHAAGLCAISRGRVDELPLFALASASLSGMSWLCLPSPNIFRIHSRYERPCTRVWGAGETEGLHLGRDVAINTVRPRCLEGTLRLATLRHVYSLILLFSALIVLLAHAPSRYPTCVARYISISTLRCAYSRAFNSSLSATFTQSLCAKAPVALLEALEGCSTHTEVFAGYC